jgi:RNA polymerase sigma-70 factor (sigma-E family)
MVSATAVSRQGVGMETDDFSTYVAARGDALLQFAYVLTGNGTDAQDIVQDALWRALPRWDRIRAVEDVDAYVRRMVVNAHISWWRRFKRRESPTADVRPPAAASRMDTSEVVLSAVADEALWAACGRLPRGQRVAVVLRYYEEKSFKEIGELVGCAEATARSRVFRGLAALRDLLGDKEAP